MPHKPILIMAGGTGGHVYPALAVADYLREKDIPLFWLGTRRGMEARVVPAMGYALLTLNISGLRGKGFMRWLLAPWSLLSTTLKALHIIRRIQPAAVLGMGGFVSGPGGIAAWCLSVPLCIHEQNAISGLTNRVLSRLADRVFAAFPGTFPDSARVTVTGNPVRAEITAIAPPEQRFRERMENHMRILVLGGSQGARTLNRVVPETLAAMPRSMKLHIHHQTGDRFYDEAKDRYNTVSHTVQLEPFIEDVATAYAWADLVICRAGALTIAELAMAGVAAILIPFPYAVDDHQTANARFMVDAGAAVCIQERQLDRKSLQALLMEFYQDRPRLELMAGKARTLARPGAARDVAAICLEVAYGG